MEDKKDYAGSSISTQTDEFLRVSDVIVRIHVFERDIHR